MTSAAIFKSKSAVFHVTMGQQENNGEEKKLWEKSEKRNVQGMEMR